MKANFAPCLAFTLRYEGGTVDDPRDPGGRTNQGVTQRTFSAWLTGRGEPPRDVFGMRPGERDAIYKSGFWDAVRANAVPEGVDLALFDFSVNSGPARALKAYAKRSSNDGAATVRTICASRLAFLYALGSFRTFGRGWTARVMACEALGVKMAEHARIGVPADAATVPQVASRLQAESRAAHRRAVQATKAGSAIAVGGGAAHPAVVATTHLPWSLTAFSVLVLAGVVAAILWKAQQARLRAAAYAAVATA